jgi:HK97 family phage portal protein
MIWNPFRREKADHSNSTLSDPDEWLVQAIMGGLKSSSGISVTPQSALGVSTVLACVNVISKAIATLPIEVYEKSNEGKKKATGHPLYELLHLNPNDDMTTCEFLMAMQGNLTLRGNAYALISKNGLGTVKSITPIDPADIQSNIENGILVYHINGSKVQPKRIIHLRGLSCNGLIGYNTLSFAKDAIALSIAMQDDIGAFFKNGAKVGSMLMTDQNLNAAQVQKLREAFDSRHKGQGNSYKSAILTNGLKPFIDRFSYNDTQLIDQRQYQTTEIARVFGVSLSKIQVESAQPRANVTENNRDFVTATLTPYVVGWEQRLNLSLLSTGDRERYEIRFDMSKLLRGNLEERYKSYQMGRSMGVLSVNEIRSMEDMNLIGPEGDTRIQPLNHTMLGNDTTKQTDEQIKTPTGDEV